MDFNVQWFYITVVVGMFVAMLVRLLAILQEVGDKVYNRKKVDINYKFEIVYIVTIGLAGALVSVASYYIAGIWVQDDITKVLIGGGMATISKEFLDLIQKVARIKSEEISEKLIGKPKE